ncbi:hypothetical protein ACFW2Y_34245, partial [Streptomyces sp. NPDC058877]|uniref:hypothetical protein n=1 Tax=Streptomyces sp. NPDC058877 TaxID=3346665 RepID=UPI003683315F
PMITKPVPAPLCTPTGHGPTNRPTPELAQALHPRTAPPRRSAPEGTADSKTGPGKKKENEKENEKAKAKKKKEGAGVRRGVWTSPLLL